MALAYDVTSIRNAMLDTITTRAGNAALLRIYDGTQPARGGTATTLLAELTCNATFAPAASGGVLTLNAITQDSSANATGTATWFRIVKSDGNTVIAQAAPMLVSPAGTASGAMPQITVSEKDAFISSVIIGRSRQEDVPFVVAELKRVFEAEYVSKLAEANLKIQDLLKRTGQ